MRRLKIFVSAPADLAPELGKVKSAVSRLQPLAESVDVTLEPVTWETGATEAGHNRRTGFAAPMSNKWDVFIGLLWHRFGPSRKSPRASSGTEEEFQMALAAAREGDKNRILLYRCTRPVPLDALNPEQFRRLRKFFAELESAEGGQAITYSSFDTAEEFERLLLNDLQRLLLEYGDQVKAEVASGQIIQPLTTSIPNNLPHRAPFFGREREMQVVMRALSPEDRTWGVLVDGIGGIGKTALAVEAAHRCREQDIFDAFIFVSAKQNLLASGGIRELTPAVRVLDDFLNETARLLGHPNIPQLAGDEKRRALLGALGPARALLVYDNLETLSKSEQEEMADFLRQLPPGCKAIITSRRRGGEGAVWLRLEKLDWEAGRAIIESEMVLHSDLGNKLRHVGEERLRELYDETKGSPLALMHTLGLLRVRAGLTFDGAVELLRNSAGSDLQKFVFQEARRELKDSDEAALRALSFFRPSATPEAWAAVAGLSSSALEMSLDRLSALSLVDLLPGEERFGLHPLTRDFVRNELLAEQHVAHEVGLRFASYWVAYAKQYGGGRLQYRTFSLLEAEWENLHAASEWLWAAAGVDGKHIVNADMALALNDLAVALGNATGPLFFAGRWDEYLQLNTRTYDAMRLVGKWRTAGWRAHRVIWIHMLRENIEEASRWLERCAEAWAREGGKNEQATVAQLRGQMARKRGEIAAAERYLQQTLETWRELGKEMNVASALNELGILEYERQSYEAAKQYWLEALTYDERTGTRDAVAGRFVNLGILAVTRRHWNEAREWFEKALSIAREVGQQALIAKARYGLAMVYEAEGKFDPALQMMEEVLATENKLGLTKDSFTSQEMIERLKRKING